MIDANVLALLAIGAALLAPSLAAIVTVRLTSQSARQAAVEVGQHVQNTVLAATDETKRKVDRVQAAVMATTADTNAKVEEVHVLVNSQRSELLEKIARLEARIFALTGEGPELPHTKSEVES